MASRSTRKRKENQKPVTNPPAKRGRKKNEPTISLTINELNDNDPLGNSLYYIYFI